ncbi:hypothetical protein [Butyrivibrio sp. VCB2001]|uniref:hypothetical protein n=1 Tax=Butyrivibrio sp. VCB2001 TaxID=1280667 RepID=UPI0003F67E8F|nr:hypothetical protein [Butyrivibrio sp. VCB2001]
MENVKFVRSEEKGRILYLYFKIHDRVADFIRKHTHYYEALLSDFLDTDNIYRYSLDGTECSDELRELLIETIEKISNEGSDDYFCNHLITNNGRDVAPSKIHELMREKYGLADIDAVGDTEDYDQGQVDLEWWTAHFFISLKNVIFDDPYPFEGDDEAQPEAMCHETLSFSEVSDFLKILKSIDKIVVVDDVRKHGPEELSRLCEELKEDDKED